MRDRRIHGQSENPTSSLVARNVLVGHLSRMLPFCAALTGTRIAPHVVFGLDGDIAMGRNVAIGPYVKLHTAAHRVGFGSRRMRPEVTSKLIVVEDGVWIAMDSLILPGVTLGRGSVISAGSVVTQDVPPNTLVGGNPAVMQGTLPFGDRSVNDSGLGRPPGQKERRMQCVSNSIRAWLHIDPYGNLFEDRPKERLKKALSPRYLANKLALIGYENAHPYHPWITRAAIAHLEEYLCAERRGFEWGSGRGSVWLAQRSQSLVSVEHHAEWYRSVSCLLKQHGLQNVDYRFVNESDYTDTITEFPKGHFDYVLVDGLLRDKAFLNSIPKVKTGGWIILDNANWYLPSDSRTPQSRSFRSGPASEGWQDVRERVCDWRTIWTTNGVNDTAIFIKPATQSK
jgi:serine acetyltransferase